MNASESKFTVTITLCQNKLGFVLPFQPDCRWGRKPVHHVSGTVGGHPFRGKLSCGEEPAVVLLKPAWLRDHLLSAGDQIEVVLKPEGPQRGELDPDIADALQGSPRAAAVFDGLAQFYRKKYLAWIQATKKSPAERQRRIAETIRSLEAGRKERP